MVGLRTQLSDAGMSITDQSFYAYFTESFPDDLDPFISLYKDNTHNVNLLCDKFSKYEMRLANRAQKRARRIGVSTEVVALASQQTAEKDEARKGKEKRDLSDVMCYGCGKKGHLRRNCAERRDERSKDEEPTAQGEASGSKTDRAGADKKLSSGTLYTAFSHASLSATKGLTDRFYVDSGASDHIVPSRSDLCSYREFEQPLEIVAAGGGKIYAYRTGYLRVASSASGIEREVDLEDIFFVPGIHVRLLSLGKLEDQGWDIRLRNGGMELWDREGAMFAIVSRVDNVYPMKLKVKAPGLAAWIDDGGRADLTHLDLVERLEGVAMDATAKGGKGSEATLMTWHR